MFLFTLFFSAICCSSSLLSFWSWMTSAAATSPFCSTTEFSGEGCSLCSLFKALVDSSSSKTYKNKQWKGIMTVAAQEHSQGRKPDFFLVVQAGQNWRAPAHLPLFLESLTEWICNSTHISLMLSGQQALLYLQLQLINFFSCRFLFLHCLALTCFYVQL